MASPRRRSCSSEEKALNEYSEKEAEYVSWKMKDDERQKKQVAEDKAMLKTLVAAG